MSPTAYDNILFDLSTNNLRALVSGRMVGIRRITRDRYGRTVAELFINNKNVGQQQVMSGHAVISQEHAWQCAWTSGL
jgi:endonuclease YncB( thermonuclease family)